MATDDDTPPESLWLDIQRTSEMACALLEQRQTANTPLPPPVEGSLQDFLRALCQIQNAYWRDAKPVLEAANEGLSEIRAAHVRHEDAAPADGDAPPAPERDDRFDQSFLALIGQVSTTYRAFLSFVEEARPEPSPAIADPDGQSRRDSAADQLKAMADVAEAQARAVDKTHFPNSVDAEQLKRRNLSLANIERTGAAIVRLPTVLIDRAPTLAQAAEGVARSLELTAQMIEASIRLYQSTKDITSPIRDAQRSFVRNLRKVISDATKGAPEVLRATAARLRSKNRTKSTSTGTHTAPTQKDAENTARQNILSGLTTSAEISALVRNLNLSGTSDSIREIPDPSLISQFSMLETLNLEFSRLEDLSWLNKLDNLWKLNLIETTCDDYSPIRFLSKLQILWLDGSTIKNLDCVAGLGALKELAIDDTIVSDIQPLQHLANLNGFFANGTQIENLTPLEALKSLTGVEIGRTLVNDISSIGTLSAISHLNLSDTNIYNIDTIKNLINLQRLWLDGSKITDISPLKYTLLLELLSIDNTRVDNLDALKFTTNLTVLSINHTIIDDIKSLANLKKLDTISMIGTPIHDWSPVDHIDNVDGRPDDWPRKSS